MKQSEKFQIAVIGNPNSGKSTFINALAGSRLTVGNWPGVTVEKTTAILKMKEYNIRVMDLPGIYSLRSFSEEEKIAAQFLMEEKPSILIQVADSTNLERHLNLTMQLTELKIPMLLVLNFQDEAKKKNITIDTKLLEENLGVKIIYGTATKGDGVKEVLETIDYIQKNNFIHYIPKTIHYSKDLETSILEIEKVIKTENCRYPVPARMVSLMMLDGTFPGKDHPDAVYLREAYQKSIGHFQKAHDEKVEEIVAENRFAAANGLYRLCVKTNPITREDITDKMDQVLLNKYVGIPSFFLIIWLLFKITFDVASPFVGWLEYLTDSHFKPWSEALLTYLSAPDWFISLFVDGGIAGISSVLVFTPVIFLMMMALTFLEASGYLSRAAFLMDKTMHFMGLHGKSFIPMVLGFGCNVPSVYATRILESKRDKILTALLSPLMSCSARLPVYVLFAGLFFPKSAGSVIFSIYALGILAAFFMGFIFKKTLFQGDSPEFIMELPPYRIPSFKTLFIHTWEKVKHFIIKAGTFILAMSIVIWFLFHFPMDAQSKKDSYFGQISQATSIIFQPLGFSSWQTTSAILSGIVAKEVVVSTFAEVYSESKESVKAPPKKLVFWDEAGAIVKSFFLTLRDAGVNLVNIFTVSSISLDSGMEENSPAKVHLKNQFNPASAYAFMVFILLYTPCMVVLIAMRNEFGSWRWPAVSIGYQFVLAWLTAFVVYQAGGLFL